MTNPASAFMPAIEALEKDLADLERQANGLLQSINLLRGKAGLPPHPGGWKPGTEAGQHGTTTPVKLHSDTFTGKRLGAAVREYLEMRKKSGADAPATSREIFDALKEGGFVSGAKDDQTGLVVLRTLLRKNTTTFVKLNGKYALRAWYPNLRQPKDTGVEPQIEEVEEGEEDETADAEENEATAPEKEAAAS